MIQLSLIFFVFICSIAEAKVRIFAHYFGQPEFIKYQHLFLKKNLLDEYEFVIFEDSRDKEVSRQIKSECKKYEIGYVRIPDSIFDFPKFPVIDSWTDKKSPSFQCSVATQYIYDHYVVQSRDICMILDNDIFLLSPLSIEEFLGDYSFSYVKENKINLDRSIAYMLPNFIIFNPTLMPEKVDLNFNMGSISNVRTDSGGFTYFYLFKHRSLGREIPRYYLYNTSSLLKDRFCGQCPLLFNSEEWGSHYFLEKEKFLHIRMGSNWSNHPNYSQMKREFFYLFDQILLH